MKKIFTFLIALFAITLAKAGTFGMGDYVWKDDATQATLKQNDAYTKNDRKPVNLEMELGMWTFFKTQGKGTIVLQYALGNANDSPYVAGSEGTAQVQSPNYRMNWVTNNTYSLVKDWVLARGFSTLTEGDYTPGDDGLNDYSDVGAYAGPTATIPSHIVDFGGKALTSTATGVVLDGTQVPGFVANEYNYMKGRLKYAIMPGSTIKPDTTYSFRLLTTDAYWDGQHVNAGSRQADISINFNNYEALQNEIVGRASEGQPHSEAVNGGNHFDHGMPFIFTGPNIADDPSLSVKWATPGLQASYVNGIVKLNWGTETEINTKAFVIERSVRGTNSFTKLGSIASKAENGVSTSTLKYTFTDYAPIAKAVYRVGEIAADGTVSYSNSVQANGASANTALSVYPNPVVGTTLHVKGVTAGSIYRIVSINGINAANGVIASSKSVNVSKLAAGVYVLQVGNKEGLTQSVMFVKK